MPEFHSGIQRNKCSVYILGTDIEIGVSNLTQKYGKICGFWLGPQRTVVVADFEILQELLNRSETSDRQVWAVAGEKTRL